MTRRSAHGMTLDRAADWRDRAACRDEDPELFFPIGTSSPALLQAKQAKAVCAGCPVKRQCLRASRQLEATDGIWGGMTPTERRYAACREASRSTTDRLTKEQ